MKRTIWLFITMLILMVVSTVLAQDASVQTMDSAGWINWDRQMIKAVGHGVIPGDVEDPAQATLMAKSAAIADAYRNLAMVTNGVRVTGDTYVKNYVTQSDEVRTKVEGLIHGAEIVSEKQLPDRSFEIILQMPMAGSKSLIRQLSPEVLPTDGSESAGQPQGSITGLIIDARGLDVKPAMSPKVFDENGKEVYGTVQVSPDYAIQSGIAVYPHSIAQALKSPRAGKKPLVIKALSRVAKFPCDLIVSARDAESIRDAEQTSGILSRCRVSILLGSEESK